MFILILFFLGLAFGYAAGWPWSLIAFVVPVLLAIGASNRSAALIVTGFLLTAAGIFVGMLLARRADAAEA